jgi:hypothetical protein
MIPDSLFRCEVCDRIHGRHCEPTFDDDMRAIRDNAARAGAFVDRFPPIKLRRVDDPGDILDQAREIVRHGAGAGHADRDPGHVEMERLGRVWGALLGTDPIPARTVALMMVGMKLVRGVKRIDQDDEIDACGYLLIASDCRENE